MESRVSESRVTDSRRKSKEEDHCREKEQMLALHQHGQSFYAEREICN